MNIVKNIYIQETPDRYKHHNGSYSKELNRDKITLNGELVLFLSMIVRDNFPCFV